MHKLKITGDLNNVDGTFLTLKQFYVKYFTLTTTDFLTYMGLV